jgi:hypothetical protein
LVPAIELHHAGSVSLRARVLCDKAIRQKI